MRAQKFTPVLKFLLAFLLATPNIAQTQTLPTRATVGQDSQVLQIGSQTVKELGQIFVSRPQLLDAFLDAIRDYEDADKIHALGIQIGKNEEVFEQLSKLVMERSQIDPALAEILKKNAEVVYQALKTKPMPTPSVTERAIEFLFFTGSYVGILYSLNGIDPMMADASFDSAFQHNLGMYTILLVIMARQGMGLASATREYVKSLKERKKSRQFFKSFQSWMNMNPFLKKMRSLEGVYTAQRASQEGLTETHGLTADLFEEYFAELKKLEEAGLARSFANLRRQSEIKNHIKHFLSFLSPNEKEKLRSAHPEQTILSDIKYHYHSQLTYNAVKKDIADWMRQEKLNELSELRTQIQQKIDSHREVLSSRTRLSMLERINIRVLTIGTILLGGAISIAAAPANFDWFFSESLMNSLRTEEAKGYLGLATFILPAFSLMLHEFSWIRDLKKRLFGKRHLSRLQQEVESLEKALNLLTVLELDPDGSLFHRPNSSQEPQTSISTQALIESMTFRLHLSESDFDKCQRLLRARRQ